VKARGITIGADSVQALLTAKVRELLGPQLREGEDWQIDEPRIPGTIVTPESGGKIEIEISPRFAGAGQETASVLVFMDGQQIHRQSISFVVRRWERVARLARAVRKGEALDSGAVEMVREETTFQRRKILRSLDEAVGRTALRNLREGDILVDNWLETPYAVREGDKILVTLTIGGASITAPAIAKENAFKGAKIQAVNPDTRKEMTVRVTGPGKAEML
jgi:flagella basal body P-ring formation protein FlgA